MNTEIILLIFSCQKYAYKVAKQKDTWLQNFTTIPYYHVIGNPLLAIDFQFDHDNKVLFVKVADDYNSLPKKVIGAFKAVITTFPVKYIFKTDDDQNLLHPKFFDNIAKLLLTNNNNNNNNTVRHHYGGHIINVKVPYLSGYHTIHPELPKQLPVLATQYCSGRFYFVSSIAVQQLISKKELIDKEYLEDYAIGYHMEPCLKTNMMSIQTNKYLVDFDFDFDLKSV